MQRYTVRCPHCKNILDIGSGEPKKKIGNPLKKCPFCGRSYIDQNVKEWVTMSPFKRVNFIAFKPFAFGILISIFFVGIVSELFDINSTITNIMRIGTFLFSVIYGSFLVKDEIKKDIEESLQRTESKKYVDMLKFAKFKIYPIKGVKVGYREEDFVSEIDSVKKSEEKSINMH